MNKIPNEWPVWWETFDGREAGHHRAKVLNVRPYVGKYSDMFSHILTLAAPRTSTGSLEMSVDLRR